MDPSIWGPLTWKVFFSIAFETDGKTCISYFDKMKSLIPCPHCRSSYNYYFAKYNPNNYIKDNEPLSGAKWVWCIKDLVNQKLGKECIPFSMLQKRYNSYTKFCSEWDVIDMLIIFSLNLETEEASRDLANSIPIIQEALQTKNTLCDCITVPSDELVNPATLWRHMIDCKIEMQKKSGLPIQTREDIKKQYDLYDDNSKKSSKTIPASNMTTTSTEQQPFIRSSRKSRRRS